MRLSIGSLDGLLAFSAKSLRTPELYLASNGNAMVTNDRYPGRRLGSSLTATFLIALLAVGCTSSHYRKSADKEVYNIIKSVDNQVFGRTNDFSINTRYSARDPKAIPSAEIIEDRTGTNRMVINLSKALELAVQSSREYQTQKEQLYLTSLTLTGARYEFGPQFLANGTAQVAGGVRKGSEAKGSFGGQLGVSQLLKTGGKLTATLGNDLVRYFAGRPDNVVRNTAINTLSVSLTQPILRGFGVNDPSVEALTQAERNVVYAIRTFSLYQQQFAVDVVNAYFTLLTQKNIVRNNYRDYLSRAELTKYLDARSVDRERKSSVYDARTSELSSRTSYINSLANYLTAMDSFKTRLGLPISTDLFLEDQDLQELISAGVTEVDVDRSAAFRLCVEKQMEILNAIDRFEDTKRKVRVAKDQLRTEASLFGTASLSSDAPDDYTQFDINKVRYTAGIRVNLPVDRLRERNAYRSSLVSFESQVRSLATTLDNYKDRIDRGLRTAEQARLTYLNAVESLKVAERRVENNKMLLDAGRATPRDSREAQDSLVQAQNSLVTTYTVFLSARLGLLLNMGVIDTRPERFWLTDPLKDLLTAEQRSVPILRMPEDKVLPPESFLEPAS